MHSLDTIIAKYFIIVPLIIAFVVWLKLDRRKKIEFVVIGFASAILAVIFAKIGSHLFYDPRPFVVGHFTPYFAHGNDNGFPSDHTLFGTLLACVTFVYNRRLGLIALAFALLVGVARVVAGVHHTIDIVGALCISALSVFIISSLVTWYTNRHKTQPKSE